MNPTELLAHCQTILRLRRIKGKPVILCEGKIEERRGHKSPQGYSKGNEKFQDAKFYRRCVPRNWIDRPPAFVNCGGKSAVIATYFRLKQFDKRELDQSYLSIDKLFALVDLDIQDAKSVGNEPQDDSWQGCHQAFADLYRQGRICQDAVTKHHIWPTGLIHKEAYFLIPALQEVFDEHPTRTLDINGQPLQLMELYKTMAQELLPNSDMETFWEQIRDRVSHCQDLDCSTPETWRDSWLTKFQDSATDESTQQALIYALLSICKAKSYWKALKPEENEAASIRIHRDQITRAIGLWYSQNYEDPRNHISFLLDCLHQAL